MIEPNIEILHLFYNNCHILKKKNMLIIISNATLLDNYEGARESSQ